MSMLLLIFMVIIQIDVASKRSAAKGKLTSISKSNVSPKVRKLLAERNSMKQTIQLYK